MYYLFWHNRFADSMRTCYTLEYCENPQTVVNHVKEKRGWEKRYVPGQYLLFGPDGPIDVHKFMGEHDKVEAPVTLETIMDRDEGVAITDSGAK